MQRAKLYIDKLANGIDPISNQELPEKSTLNNVRLSRCFFYVSGILSQVIENGGVVNAPSPWKKTEFTLSDEAMKGFAFSIKPLRITELVGRINDLVDLDAMKKLTTTVVTDWLLEKGFLGIQENQEGKKTRIPTVRRGGTRNFDRASQGKLWRISRCLLQRGCPMVCPE